MPEGHLAGHTQGRKDRNLKPYKEAWTRHRDLRLLHDTMVLRMVKVEEIA